MLPLACSVRDCSGPLERRGRTWVCPRGHSYDIARSGYVNLLQPQDRKSAAPGDSRESVEARAALLARGVGRATIDAVTTLARRFIVAGEPAVVVELGAGSGETLGSLASLASIHAIGIDLSTAAATHAARRFPDLTWVVGNADRRLPLLSGQVDVVLSIHARRNPSECHRVLQPLGRLIVAVPAADDLIELREAVLGEAVGRDRTSTLIEEHAELFDVIERSAARQRLELERDALLQLLRGTYRGERLSESPRVQSLDRMTVTLASDVVVFAPRR